MRTFMFERPSKNKSYTELANQLTAGRNVVLERATTAAGDAKAHGILTHVTGIERWAQNRIRVALGEQFRDEEYDGYRPAKELSWADAQQQFEATRNDTLALCGELMAAGVDSNTKVRHNSFGEMAISGWLQYIYGHTDFETKSIK